MPRDVCLGHRSAPQAVGNGPPSRIALGTACGAFIERGCGTSLQHLPASGTVLDPPSRRDGISVSVEGLNGLPGDARAFGSSKDGGSARHFRLEVVQTAEGTRDELALLSQLHGWRLDLEGSRPTTSV